MKRQSSTAALVAVAVTFCLLAGPTNVLADENDHKYKDGDELNVYANKIGPFNNPLETYAFFELPGCPPASWEHKFPSLGQALVGDEMFKMKTPISFKKDQDKAVICKFTPTKEQADQWNSMIQQQYWYQLYADDLPMWATLGKMFSKTRIKSKIYR